MYLLSFLYLIYTINADIIDIQQSASINELILNCNPTTNIPTDDIQWDNVIKFSFPFFFFTIYNTLQFFLQYRMNHHHYLMI